MVRRISLLALVVAAACGGSSSSHEPDAMTSIDAAMPDASWRLADRMPRATVMDKTQIMAHPVVVPIVFDDDPDVASLPQFYDAFGSSSAWSDETAEYGVGPMTAGATQSLGPMPSSITLQALIDTLVQNTGGTAPPWGLADENTIYAFHIPDGVTLDDGAGGCCVLYTGFHDQVMVGTTPVAYAIDCQCPGDAANLGISNLEQRTFTMAHEAVEAATDPRFDGWRGTDDAHAAWTYVFYFAELADLCELTDTSVWRSNSSGFAVQRSWSNKAVAAGHDPCVGDTTGPYYQTVPDDPDSASITFEDSRDASGSARWHAKGTRIAVGGTGTVAMRLLADDATAGPFQVQAYDLSGLIAFGQIGGTYMPDDRVTVSATVKATDPKLQGAEAYTIATRPIAGGPATYYYALIVQ